MAPDCERCWHRALSGTAGALSEDVRKCELSKWSGLRVLSGLVSPKPTQSEMDISIHDNLRAAIARASHRERRDSRDTKYMIYVLVDVVLRAVTLSRSRSAGGLYYPLRWGVEAPCVNSLQILHWGGGHEDDRRARGSTHTHTQCGLDVVR